MIAPAQPPENWQFRRPPLWGPLRRFGFHKLRQSAALPPGSPVEVCQDIAVQLRDGTTLLADLWRPVEPGRECTVLVRTPYGRVGAGPVARLLAEQGFHVLVQSCRGTFGSGGRFDPFADEESDGADTLAFIAANPIIPPTVIPLGISYQAIAHYAMLSAPRPDPIALAGLVTVVSARSVREAIIYPGGGFGIETAVTWATLLRVQEKSLLREVFTILKANRQIPQRCAAQPVEQADPSPFVADWLAHPDPDDPWWATKRFAQDAAVIPPLVSIAGWHDLFLDEQVADFQAVESVGGTGRLVIGSWTHASPEPGAVALSALVRLADQPPQTTQVDFQIGGTTQWRRVNSWPPPATPQVHYLSADQRLTAHAPTAADLDYRYDPADPTPMAGGRGLNMFTSGAKRQDVREARPDVLVFTSARLTEPLTIAGDIEVHLEFGSDHPHADLFVRLSVVDPDGVSTNVTDTFVRCGSQAPQAPPLDDPQPLSVTLAPTAYRFAAGRRLRLQVSSGAHPLYLRNSGNADPVRDNAIVRASTQRIRLGSSRLILPTVPDDAGEQRIEAPCS